MTLTGWLTVMLVNCCTTRMARVVAVYGCQMSSAMAMNQRLLTALTTHGEQHHITHTLRTIHTCIATTATTYQ